MQVLHSSLKVLNNNQINTGSNFSLQKGLSDSILLMATCWLKRISAFLSSVGEFSEHEDGGWNRNRIVAVFEEIYILSDRFNHARFHYELGNWGIGTEKVFLQFVMWLHAIIFRLITTLQRIYRTFQCYVEKFESFEDNCEQSSSFCLLSIPFLMS